MSDHERLMLQFWLDSGAQFAGTYTALGSGMVIHLNTPNTAQAQKVMNKRCAECHSGKTKLPRWPGDDFGEKEYIHLRGKKYGVVPPWVTETQLKKLPSEGPRAHSVEWVKKYLEQIKRFNMPGFVPNEHYVAMLKEFGVLAADHQPDGSISPYEYDRR